MLGKPQTWWRDQFGLDSTTSRKGVKQEESGEVRGTEVTLTVDPIRIRWMVKPATANPENILADPQSFLCPVLGSFGDAKGNFLSLMERWLPSCPPIKRLAFAGRLVWFAESTEATYERLQQFLHQVKFIPGSKELQFRINRPRSVQVAGTELSINRLSTWTSVKAHGGLRVAGGGMPLSQEMLPLAAFYMNALDFDINTPADRTDALPKESLSVLFRLLVSMASEIAENGDIP